MVEIVIEQTNPTKAWSFRDSYAGALGLGHRIRRFQAIRSGARSQVRAIAPGEFRSEDTAQVVGYEAQIPPGKPADLSHVSWLTNDYGYLMLADLLPLNSEFKAGVWVTIELPQGWKVHSSSKEDCEGKCFFNDPENAVFLVGTGIRSASTNVDGMDLRIAAQGNWNFTNKDVLKWGTALLEGYFQLTSHRLRESPTILIAPLPLSDSSPQWKAETRGSTLILLLNSQASRNNWHGLISIIFTHELFHLWVPNSLRLSGDYDWFFEGFTLYVALQEALRLKLIRFSEYLNTLARVYDSYLSYSDNLSLIESSESRWTSSQPSVYDKGMLAAFVYDLIVRRESKGQTSLRNQYRLLFKSPIDEPTNANEVIIKLLTASPATSDFARSYIETRDRIELEKVLPSFGIDIDRLDRHTRLSIRKHLTYDQRELLQSLGYRR